MKCLRLKSGGKGEEEEKKEKYDGEKEEEEVRRRGREMKEVFIPSDWRLPLPHFCAAELITEF